jgi:hypothetical protein
MAKVRALRFYAGDIINLLSGKFRCVKSIPEDAELVRYGVQWETNSAIVIIKHDSFNEIDESKQIPIADVIIREI